MNYSFQNINANCPILEQEHGGTFLFIDQSYAQLIDEQQRESADTLFEPLL